MTKKTKKVDSAPKGGRRDATAAAPPDAPPHPDAGTPGGVGSDRVAAPPSVVAGPWPDAGSQARSGGSVLGLSPGVASRAFFSAPPLAPPSSTLVADLARPRSKRRWSRDRVFLTLGSELGAVNTPEEAARVVMRSADRLFGWDCCTLSIYSQEKDRMYPILSMDTFEDGRRVVAPPDDGAIVSHNSRRVFSEGAQLILRSPEEIESEAVATSPAGGADDAPFQGLIPFGNMQRRSASLMYVPIRRAEKIVGVFSAQSYTPYAYARKDLKTLQALADHCGGALDRTFAEAALVEAHSDLARRVEERTRELSEANAQLQREMGERIRAEEQARLQHERLVQTDRLVALGTLVSGVAHEINNPNNFILLNTSVIEEAWHSLRPVLDRYREECGDFPVGGLMYSEMRDQMDVLLAGILDGARRIDTIVRELRDFTKRRPAECMQAVDLNAVVRSALLLLDNLVRSKTDRFVVDLGKGLPPLRGHPQRLEQVVANLVQNAWQALPGPDRAIAVVTRYDPRRDVAILRVEDEGVGIAPEALKHITDPFYTTKREEGGMGLGLSISSSIVDEHEGTMTLESTPGAGTVVTVVLPVSPPDFSPLADSP